MSPATHLALADYTTKLYYVWLISFNMRGWFNANFIYATKSRREVGCKNVGGTPVLFRERALPNFLSLFLSLASLYSFLPSFLSRYENHAVYISSGYYMHILLSCIRFFTLPRISSTSPTSSPPISRAYAILHGAHASLTPPHSSPRSPSLSSSSSFHFCRFEIQTPGDW